HERLVEQAAGLQVVQQGRVGQIEVRQVVVAQDGEVALVRVPAVVVEAVAGPVDVPGDVDEAGPPLPPAAGGEGGWARTGAGRGRERAARTWGRVRRLRARRCTRLKLASAGCASARRMPSSSCRSRLRREFSRSRVMPSPRALSGSRGTPRTTTGWPGRSGGGPGSA